MNNFLSNTRSVCLVSLLTIGCFLLVTTAWSQGFVQRSDNFSNPFYNIYKGFPGASPSLADLNGDGNLDAVVVRFDGNTYYYKNTGNAPQSESQVYADSTSPFTSLPSSPYGETYTIFNPGQDSPANIDFSFGDLDGDGDLDAISGNVEGKVLIFINTGSKTNPLFPPPGSGPTGPGNPPRGVAAAPSTDPFGSISYPTEGTSLVSLADFDGDGDLDVLVVTDVGVHYLRNTGSPGSPTYTEVTGSGNPFNGFTLNADHTNPAVGDIDGDGDLDVVICGEFAAFYRNVGTVYNPVFTLITGPGDPFNGINLGYKPRIALGDVDKDGDIDAAVGEYYGNVTFLENVQRISQQPTPASLTVCPGSSVSTSIQAQPDAVTYQWYRNTQNSTTPVVGQTSATLNLTNVQPGDAGLYYARISVSYYDFNDFDSRTVYLFSDAFSLTVQNPAAPVLTASALTSNQPISVTASGCQGGTINWSPQGGTGTANGAIYTFTQPGNYTLTATCTMSTCTSPSSAPLKLSILPGGFAITTVTMVNCQLFDEAKGGYQVSFTPGYSGQNANPISFSIVNEKLPTTDPGPYTVRLYTDNPMITLVANQMGNGETRYRYNWFASCQSGNSPNRPPTTTGVPNQTILQGQAYQLELKNYFSDPDQQPLTFSAQGLPNGLSLTGSVISGVPSMTGISTVSVSVLDPGGLSASTMFMLTVTPTPAQPTGFFITGVSTVSCQVLTPQKRRLTFTPQYSGVNNTPITFSVVNESLPTTNPGPYNLDLYTDNPVIRLNAQQGASVAQFAYNWLTACNSSGRLGVSESGAELQVRVLGNPVEGKLAQIEISGVVGQSVQLTVVDLQGRVLHRHQIGEAAATERVSVPVEDNTGLLILRVNTPTQSQQVKLLKR